MIYEFKVSPTHTRVRITKFVQCHTLVLADSTHFIEMDRLRFNIVSNAHFACADFIIIRCLRNEDKLEIPLDDDWHEDTTTSVSSEHIDEFMPNMEFLSFSVLAALQSFFRSPLNQPKFHVEMCGARSS